MHLFRRSKKDKAKSDQTVPPASKSNPSPQPQHPQQSPSQPQPQKQSQQKEPWPTTAKPSSQQSEAEKIKNHRLRKRVSTIVDDDVAMANDAHVSDENYDDSDDSDDFDSDDDSYDSDDSDDSAASDSDSSVDQSSSDPTSYNQNRKNFHHDSKSIDSTQHSHKIQLRPHTSTQSNIASHLWALMGYRNPDEADDPTGANTSSTLTLQQVANEESKRTFSLIDEDCKIHRVSATIKRNDPQLQESVVAEYQLELIKNLTNKLNQLLDSRSDLSHQYNLVSQNKTLYQRYGVVRDVIGRGSYGLIKVIDPSANDEEVASSSSPPPQPKLNKKQQALEFQQKQQEEIDLFATGKTLYAVKELQKRPENDNGKDNNNKTESRGKFIDRVISEFIISSTLNNKHLVKSVDFMVTLPPKTVGSNLNTNYITDNNLYEANLKINQVMQCTSGTDLFTYLKILTNSDNATISIEEIDCFIKQIAKGLWYMHQHGVAHCDLKLENILLNYDFKNPSSNNRTHVNLKISDFGKSNVFRTKWDQQEQFNPYSSGPLGSEPYMAPEEHCRYIPHVAKEWHDSYSLSKKDSWALGVIILVLFNIRRHFFINASVTKKSKLSANAPQENNDNKESGALSQTSELFSEYSCSYLWQNTDVKHHSHHHSHRKERKYRDKVFGEYVKNYLIADYDHTTKEWLIKRPGSFKPIETLFIPPTLENEIEGPAQVGANDEVTSLNKAMLKMGIMDEYEQEFCELRKLFIYKLLDVNPETRLTTDDFIRGDWMQSIDSCC